MLTLQDVNPYVETDEKAQVFVNAGIASPDLEEPLRKLFSIIDELSASNGAMEMKLNDINEMSTIP